MEGLREQVLKGYDKYYDEYGTKTKYIIINAAEAQVLSYEIGIAEGLDDDEALFSEYNKYLGMFICRVEESRFNEIVIK